MQAKSTRKLWSALSLAIVLALVFAPLALADTVQNDVTGNSVNNTFELGSFTKAAYWIVPQPYNQDGQNGCNAADGSDAVVTINTPLGLTATPSTLTFKACNALQYVVFTASSVGIYPVSVTVSDTGAGDYNTNPARDSLLVVDTSGPGITINTPLDEAKYKLGEVVLADYSCTDPSGVAKCEGPVPSGTSIDTGSVGSKSFTVDAADTHNNIASLTHYYSVIYNFAGFFDPVHNNVLNVAKAGSAVPMKFSLSGDQGLGIFASGYPIAIPISCTGEATVPVDEIVTAGGSSLSYDALEDQYVYVWKTEKAWSGTCRQLNVILIDGTSHVANFQFK